jgi:hypothetical protein
MKNQQECIKSALVELIKLCTSKGCRVVFSPPIDDCFGTFIASTLQITVFKERPDRLTVQHVFTLAHEYKHLLQYLEFNEVDEWLYSIDATNKPNPEQDIALEKEADLFALQFCRDRKLKIPKTVMILGNEVTFYE